MFGGVVVALRVFLVLMIWFGGRSLDLLNQISVEDGESKMRK